MKQRFFSLLLVWILAIYLSQAFALGSGTKAIGDVFLKNGGRLESVELEMPNERDAQVNVKIDGIQQKLATDSIDGILLWNKKYPDMKHFLKPFLAEIIDLDSGETIGFEKRQIWLCCEQAEENASRWFEIGRPSFKKGNLRFNFRSQYSYKSMQYILKKGKDNPAYLPDKTKDVIRFIKVYFSDDPELIQRLESGKYEYSDWGYKSVDIRRIISDYVPR